MYLKNIDCMSKVTREHQLQKDIAAIKRNLNWELQRIENIQYSLSHEFTHPIEVAQDELRLTQATASVELLTKKLKRLETWLLIVT